MRSEPERLVASQFPDWKYEPITLSYTAYYKPDFVTPNGTIVELKSRCDSTDLKRLREVSQTLAMRGQRYVVMVFMTNNEYVKKSMDKKGQGWHLVNWLRERDVETVAYCPRTLRDTASLRGL